MKRLALTKINNQKAIAAAIQVLEDGGLVVYPTETCYGLGADATNQAAIDKLLTYKRRREGKPLSVLVADQKIAQKYVELNESARRLYEQFLPGPMTVISQCKNVAVLPSYTAITQALAKGVASELNTLGIRISSHPFAMALAQAYGKPITATSANASWKKKPYSIQDILGSLSSSQEQKLDLCLDAGALPKNEVTTIVDTTLLDTMVLRKGAVDLAQQSSIFDSDSPLQTQRLAQTLMLKQWNDIRTHGIVYALSGDLGAGKTIFTKGIGSFLGIKEPITSPSYTLVQEYFYQRHHVKGMLYHLDPWRLGSFQELEALDIDTMLGPNKIVVIEWASKFLDQILSFATTKGAQTLSMNFEDLGENRRRISF